MGQKASMAQAPWKYCKEEEPVEGASEKDVDVISVIATECFDLDELCGLDRSADWLKTSAKGDDNGTSISEESTHDDRVHEVPHEQEFIAAQDSLDADNWTSIRCTPRVRERGAFDVELERTGPKWRTLGLMVSPDDDPRHLVVDDIWGPSLIVDWNLMHSLDDERRVRPNDKIVAVNGHEGSSEELLSIIREQGKGATLVLTIM